MTLSMGSRPSRSHSLLATWYAPAPSTMLEAKTFSKKHYDGSLHAAAEADGVVQPVEWRYGMVWYGMVWYGMVWYGMVWYGMVWYGMVWYGMVFYSIIASKRPIG